MVLVQIVPTTPETKQQIDLLYGQFGENLRLRKKMQQKEAMALIKKMIVLLIRILEQQLKFGLRYIYTTKTPMRTTISQCIEKIEQRIVQSAFQKNILEDKQYVMLFGLLKTGYAPFTNDLDFMVVNAEVHTRIKEMNVDIKNMRPAEVASLEKSIISEITEQIDAKIRDDIAKFNKELADHPIDECQ